MNFAADPEKKDHEFVAINPVIVEASKVIVDDREGCLSFPELYAKVQAQTAFKPTTKGELYEMTCEDLLGRVWQHETITRRHAVHVKMGTADAEQEVLKQFEDEYYERRRRARSAGPAAEVLTADHTRANRVYRT
jgi:peptide deformylase